MSDNIFQQFPFSAVTSQPQFKLALLLNAINPLIGGVLVSGPRGSAKSTLARGFANVLPSESEATHPFVTLPLNATEEMLVGTLDLEKVLNNKDIAFRPGLLAKAHQGILYVDEVNLLPDHLVDQLLDVAASGVNIVERDGVSHQHVARFILLGTMNPDEGELREQLLDRFGLSLSLSNQYSVEERMDIVKLRESFDKDPSAFCETYKEEQAEVTRSIAQAISILHAVECPEFCRRLIAEECNAANVDGMRADIVWVQSALAHAALHGNLIVSEEDVLSVKELVLNHRRNVDNNPEPPAFKRPESQSSIDNTRPSSPKGEGDWGQMQAQYQKTQRVITDLDMQVSTAAQDKSYQSSMMAHNTLLGVVKGFKKSRQASSAINWFGSLLSNAGRWPFSQLSYYPSKKGASIVHLILLDTSGSVLSNKDFGRAKGLVSHIAKQAYLNRENIAILGFGNQTVDTLLNTRRAPKNIDVFLDALKAGGGTPLQKAIMQAIELQYTLNKKIPGTLFKNYIITDGRVNDRDFNHSLLGDSVLIDIESSPVKRGKAKYIASLLQAQYLPLRA